MEEPQNCEWQDQAGPWINLRVLGLCELDPEVHAGLVRHLADKLDELTLATLVVLLRRNPETRISHADLAFLRHAHTPSATPSFPPPTLAPLHHP